MLSGYKTYITGAISVILGALGMFHLLPDTVSVGDPTLLITTGFGLIFLRNAVPPK